MDLPGQLTETLPCSTPWELTLDIPDHWAPPQTVDQTSGPCDTEAEVRFHVFPVGTLTGRLVFPDDALSELSIEFQSSPSPPGEEGSTVAVPVAVPPSQRSCPVDQGQWSCTVPATRLDLRLTSGPHIPHYLWDVKVHEGKEVDLGTRTLELGASLTGWLEWREVDIDIAATEVRIEPQRFGWHSDAEERRQLSTLKLRTKPTARGFFQFHGLSPGAYQLTARTPGAVAASLDLVLRENREVVLEAPVVLQPPIEVEVVVDPPADPLGRPWLLTVGQLDDAGVLQVRAEDEATAEGTWRSTALEPGHYLASIGDLSGGDWTERWFEVASGMRPIFMEVPVVAVEGQLRVGDEPLQTTLVFGSTQGKQRIPMETDEEGRFEGSLPREGMWPLDLVPPGDLQLNQALDPVEVRRRPGTSTAFLDLRLPDTRLAGIVMADGEPVPRARMAIVREGDDKRRDAILLADDDGEFELLGLSPGVLHAHAYSRGRKSPWVRVELEEDLIQPELHLELEHRIELSGLVLSPTGPVPGADVAIWPTLHDGSFRLLERATTGVDGSFPAEVPAGAVRADFLVMAPGFAHRLLTAEVKAPDPALSQGIPPQIIQVEAAAGALILDGIAPQGNLPTDTVLLYDRTRFPLDLLLQMLLPKGGIVPRDGALALPQMAPGSYGLCSGSPSEDTFDCPGGYLPPGGELRLGFPGAEPPTEPPTAPATEISPNR